jgi:hypothetical protein
MQRLFLLFAVLVSGVRIEQRAHNPPPAELSALATRAHLAAPIAAWCHGEFRGAHTGEYAVAITRPSRGGQYLVLEPDATAIELAAFTGSADLSCYSPAEARKLNTSMQRSETIHGTLSPRWRTTVVCGFVDDTSAVCWQYSPSDRSFVKVGEWVT